MNILKALYSRLRHRMYVLIDCSDDSVTLSKSLFRHMERACGDTPQSMFLFAVPGAEHLTYAMIPNAIERGFIGGEYKESASITPVQYDSLHHCVGFGAIHPTANQIAYDYCLPIDHPVKVTVKAVSLGAIKAYTLCR